MTEALGSYYDPIGSDMVVLKDRAYKAVDLFQSSEPCDFMFSCIRSGILMDSDKDLGKFVISRRLQRFKEDGPLCLYYQEEHNDGSGYYGEKSKVMEIDCIHIMLDCMLIMEGRTRRNVDAELDTYTSEYVYHIKGEDYDTGLRPFKKMPSRPDPLLDRIYDYLIKMRVRNLLEVPYIFATLDLHIAMKEGRKAKDIIGKRTVKMMNGCFLSQCASDWRGWEDWCLSYKQYHEDLEEMIEIANSKERPSRYSQMRLEDY